MVATSIGFPVRPPALECPLLRGVTLGRLANLSALQFFHLKTAIKITSTTLPAFEVMIKLKCRAELLAQGRRSVPGSSYQGQGYSGLFLGMEKLVFRELSEMCGLVKGL